MCLPLYAVKKNFKHFNNIWAPVFINYQQRVIAVDINYRSRPSKTLGSESQIMWRMVKFGKRTKKSKGAVRRGSPPQFHRRSPPSCSLEQASKTLKNKSSLGCAFIFHGCITSLDMKYLLWHVPVTLISLISRCNCLLLPWKIASKCD